MTESDRERRKFGDLSTGVFDFVLWLIQLCSSRALAAKVSDLGVLPRASIWVVKKSHAFRPANVAAKTRSDARMVAGL